MKTYLSDRDFTLYQGDAYSTLSTFETASIDCVVTSPPYYGLRDYGNDDQIGLEATPELYVARLVEVFGEVRRVLRGDGTLWLNLGSSYFSDPAKGGSGPNGKNESRWSYGRASRRDAASRGTTCIPPQDSAATDSACLDLCGECAGDLSLRNQRSTLLLPGSPSLAALTGPDRRRSGSSLGPPPLDAPVSTTPESSPPPPAVCWRCGIRPASVSLRVLPTSSPDAPESEGTEAHTNGNAQPESGFRNQDTDAPGMAWVNYTAKLKPKDMVPIPWMVAMALQADGWYLRSDIIWSKPNPMPESITDRPTKSHEYIFLLTKSKDYFFNQDAVREPYSPVSEDRYRYAFGGKKAEALLEADKHGVGRRTSLIGHKDFPAKQDTLSPELPPEADRGPDGRRKTTVKGADGSVQHRDGERWGHQGRNIRSVWYLPTQATPDAHFATFPEKIPERCIKAGCPEQGVVLDPFMGSGTTAIVARRLGRKCVGVELNPEYCALIERRTNQLSLLA